MSESVSKAHRLIIIELDERDPDTHVPYREWEVIHREDCAQVEIEDDFLKGKMTTVYECMVAHEVYHCGLDSLWPDWTTLAAGEHEIEAWSDYDAYNMEWDGGLRLTEETD